MNRPVPATTGLSCIGLRVCAGGRTLLDRADLHVPSGCLVTVLGPSGAGKTTLLRTIAGLWPRSGGRVVIDGRDVTVLSARRRPVGMMFQEPRLFPGLDVAENVGFALRAVRVGRRERRGRAAALLAEVGLAGYGGRAVRDLSGGEAQRVALARTFAAQPRVLLLDEPLAAVDAGLRQHLRRLVRDRQRARGLTTVYVTHDRAEAAELGDAVAIMVGGRTVQVGPPTTVFERPASEQVARLLGAANLLRVQVDRGVAAVDGARLPVGGGDGEATIAIRPERVRLDAAAPMRLQVTEVAYLGDHHRVGLAGRGIQLEAHVPLGAAPVPGVFVGVDLPAEHLWRLPVPEAATPEG